MAESLYRKYRPLTFDDVVGQDVIIRTLKNAITNNKLAHAYLFTGPRGTGKTTTARILAKALLCEHAPTEAPDGTCDECKLIAESRHPDVLELDAASRTGVENVREEIISRVNYSPQRGGYKVYIIDEVHMLSTAAFNALLKTLEEPPDKVVFILCTTDPQKVPETIHSRCQRFDFRRISTEELTARLGAVCNMEDVEFEGEALDLIARKSNGGMRDALCTLEQIIVFGEGNATLSVAQDLLGGSSLDSYIEMAKAIANGDIKSAFAIIRDAVEDGADLAQFSDDVAWFFRDVYVDKMAGEAISLSASATDIEIINKFSKAMSADKLIYILSILGDLSRGIKISSNQQLTFEIALTKLFAPENSTTLASLAERISKLEGGALVSNAVAQRVDIQKISSSESNVNSSIIGTESNIDKPAPPDNAIFVPANAPTISEVSSHTKHEDDKVDEDISKYGAPFAGGHLVSGNPTTGLFATRQPEPISQESVAEKPITAKSKDVYDEKAQVIEAAPSISGCSKDEEDVPTPVESSASSHFVNACANMLEHLYVLNKSYFFLLVHDVRFNYEPGPNLVKVVFPHDKNFAYGNVNKPACRDRIKTAFGEVGYVGVNVEVVKDDDLYQKLDALEVSMPDENGNFKHADKSTVSSSVPEQPSPASHAFDAAKPISAEEPVTSKQVAAAAPFVASPVSPAPAPNKTPTVNPAPAPAPSPSATSASAASPAPAASSSVLDNIEPVHSQEFDKVSTSISEDVEDEVPIDVYEAHVAESDSDVGYNFADLPEDKSDGRMAISENDEQLEIKKMNELLKNKFGKNVSLKFEE